MNTPLLPEIHRLDATMNANSITSRHEFSGHEDPFQPAMKPCVEKERLSARGKDAQRSVVLLALVFVGAAAGGLVGSLVSELHAAAPVGPSEHASPADDWYLPHVHFDDSAETPPSIEAY